MRTVGRNIRVYSVGGDRVLTAGSFPRSHRSDQSRSEVHDKYTALRGWDILFRLRRFGHIW